MLGDRLELQEALAVICWVTPGVTGGPSGDMLGDRVELLEALAVICWVTGWSSPDTDERLRLSWVVVEDCVEERGRKIHPSSSRSAASHDSA